MDFQHYFLMNSEDAINYIKEKSNFFAKGAKLECKEIGDGNINYIFRIEDSVTCQSLIVKQSDVQTRSKSGHLISTDRNRIEFEILKFQNEMVPGMVPKVYFYDKDMNCYAMEDLKDYSLLRTALMNYNCFSKFADQITTYLIDGILPTTDIAMDHKKKKELVKRYINPDLCSITENLVYSDSVGNFNGENFVIEGMEKFVNEEIYTDLKLRKECAIMKFHFMENAQALIHGDLHSGSIFISKDEIKVFDPEFAYYGPIGYDIGNVLAHLVISFAYGEQTAKNSIKGKKFSNWIKNCISEIFTLYREKYKKKFKAIVSDEMAKTEGFDDFYLQGILHDSVQTAGIEIIRRIVGSAKVKEFEVLKGEDLIPMEKKLIRFSKKCILIPDKLTDGESFIRVLETLFDEGEN